MGGRTVRAWVVLLLVFAAVLGACDGGDGQPEPSPTLSSEASPSPDRVTGLRVAVVLPPLDQSTEGHIASLRSALAELARDQDGIADLRVIDSDSTEFVGDTVGLLAAEGSDLVCALGPRALEQVLMVASEYPSTRFCAAPAVPTQTPGNVLPVDVRVEEVAYVAGIAAGLTSDGLAPGLIAGPQQFAFERQRRAYERGFRAVVPNASAPYIGVPAVDAEQAKRLALSQYDAGVNTIYTVAGRADRGVVEAATEVVERVATERETETETETVSGTETASPSPAPPPPPTAFVIGSEDTLRGVEDRLPDRSLYVFRDRLDVAVRLAVARALERWSSAPVSIGLVDGAFEIRPGASPAANAVRGRVADTIAAIRAGELQVLPDG